MPLGGRLFMKYHGRPPEPPPPRAWWVAPCVLAGGVALLLVLALVGLNVAGARVSVGWGLIAVSSLWTLRRGYMGWLEEGMVGMYYRLRHPLGTPWNADQETDGLELALTVVAIAACGLGAWVLWG